MGASYRLCMCVCVGAVRWYGVRSGGTRSLYVRSLFQEGSGLQRSNHKPGSRSRLRLEFGAIRKCVLVCCFICRVCHRGAKKCNK